METAVMNNTVCTEQQFKTQGYPVTNPEKKSFKKACTECNSVPLETFIDELKKRVKKCYQNAKG